MENNQKYGADLKETEWLRAVEMGYWRSCNLIRLNMVTKGEVRRLDGLGIDTTESIKAMHLDHLNRVSDIR